MNQQQTTQQNGQRRPRNAFDLFVLAGAAVNVVVVLMLFGYWVTH